MKRGGRLAWMAAAMAIAIVPAVLAAHSPQAVPTTVPPTVLTPAPPAQDIIVTGKDMPDAATVRQLARAISPRTWSDEPMARFDDPVCLATGGLPQSVLIDIANRFIDDAERAGVRLGGRHCQANILLLFVDNGQADMARILKHRPGLLSDLLISEAKRLAADPGPVHAFTSSEIRSRDGDRIYIGANGMRMLNVPIASHIVQPVRRDMLASVMLIDRSAVMGRSPNQLADYAAMRSLAQIRQAGARGGDTILTLFDADASAPPLEMTVFDRGYLKALYAGAGNTSATMKLNQISRSIVKNMMTALDQPAATP